MAVLATTSTTPMPLRYGKGGDDCHETWQPARHGNPVVPMSTLFTCDGIVHGTVVSTG